MEMRRLVAVGLVGLLAAMGSRIGWAGGLLTVNVWPAAAPGETGKIGPQRVLPPRGTKKVTRITDVSTPTLTLYRPAAEKATGCAVLVCPGGGYHILAYDLEGTEVAQWLNALGVTALLLKYRVPRRDKDAPYVAPLQDAQRALRLARSHAKDWGIDPKRLGILGFSAGGNLAVMASVCWDKPAYEPIDDVDRLSCRPDFQIPIYPAYLFDKKDRSRLSPLLRITDKTPPAFIVVTHDDADRDVYAALYYAALKRAGVAGELHIFLKGGHGYGLRPSERPVSHWPQLCAHWLKELGLLKRP